MGIWEVCRLAARRWRVSVPLFLIAAAATLVAAYNIRPDYAATTYVSLLPPTVQHTAVAGQTLTVNPWDTETLASAVVVRLNTRSYADQVKAEGFRGRWNAGRDERYKSVVRIQVTSETRAQARSILGRLLREVDDEVDRQQARYPDLAPEDKVTTAGLNAADEVEAANENVMRATVLVAVAGLVLTAGAAVAADRATRRRSRRRPGTAATSTDTDATQPVVITNVPLQVPVPVTLPSPGRHAADERAGSSGPTADDSTTIVLPLSNAPWAQRPRSAALGSGAADRDDTTVDVG